MHRTTISRIWPDLLFFMINSKGRRKSFWKWKFCNSPFSKNFKLNCFKESVAKMAICCESLQPTTLKWFPKTAHIRDLETTTFFIINSAKVIGKNEKNMLSNFFCRFSKSNYLLTNLNYNCFYILGLRNLQERRSQKKHWFLTFLYFSEKSLIIYLPL